MTTKLDLSPDQIHELVGQLDPSQYEMLLNEIEDYQAHRQQGEGHYRRLKIYPLLP